MSKFDLAVIGSGPAGYVSALRAAQLGMTVALIEKEKTLGGTCLNVGCIPSKSLLNSSEKYDDLIHHFKAHGITASHVDIDVKCMIERKDAVVKQLTSGISGLMKKNKITVFTGEASFKNPQTLSVNGKKQEDVVADKIIIASGSSPVQLPFAPFNGKTIVSSTEALSFSKVPKHLIVIGSGVIGLELGSVWMRLGAQVTLIDVAKRPLVFMDDSLGKESLKLFKKKGMVFKLGSKVTSVSPKGASVSVSLINEKGETEEIKGDKVLVSVGRKPNTDHLGLEKIGVKTDERGTIIVDENFQTNISSVYAIGDCVPGPMLAHKGSEEGVACVERMHGQKTHVNYHAVPWVVYTVPEIAGVGFTEQYCKDQNISYKVGKFNYMANGRAIAIGETEGFVKVIADAKTDKLLGMHIIGFNASEMIHEAVAVLEFGGSAEDIARLVHAHPTLSEATKEAALDVDGNALHS